MSANPPSVPTFSVYWAAKGGIADSATIFGMGEAGREALMPLQGQHMKPFARAVAENMGGSGGVNVTVSIGEFVNQTDESIDQLVNRVEKAIRRKVGMRQRAMGVA